MRHLQNQLQTPTNLTFFLYCTDDKRSESLLQQFGPIVPSQDITLIQDLIMLCNFRKLKPNQILFLDLVGVDLPLEMYQFVFNKFQHVVILSSQSNHAVWAFEYGATDFILEPVNTIRLSTTIKKLKIEQQNPIIKTENNTIFVKNSRDLIKINLNEIVYIQAMGNYIRIYLENNKCITSLEKISFIQYRLPFEQFYRIHKSFIINITFIKSYDKKEVILKDETKLPLSITYKHLLTQKNISKPNFQY
jgi:two-component system LytT family response regulator